MAEENRKEVEADPLVVKAIELLASKGPMKCGDLAHMLGLPNGRRLSMLLQWRSGKCRDVDCERGKWFHTPKEKVTA